MVLPTTRTVMGMTCALRALVMTITVLVVGKTHFRFFNFLEKIHLEVTAVHESYFMKRNPVATRAKIKATTRTAVRVGEASEVVGTQLKQKRLNFS